MCFVFSGNVDSALTLTNELLEIVPDHSRARGNIPHYEKALKENKENEKVYFLMLCSSLFNQTVTQIIFLINFSSSKSTHSL